MELDDALLTTEEVASLVRKSVPTMRYLRSIGEGPKSGKLGKHVVYRRSDVQQWIDAAFSDGEL
jgi:predicted DNA-binding transcriptional regulator AlpA